jgi:hypothetical protein
VKNPTIRRYYTKADSMQKKVYKSYLSLIKEFGETGTVSKLHKGISQKRDSSKVVLTMKNY